MAGLTVRTAIILILPLVAGLAACGGGSGAQPTPSDDTGVSISSEALGQMVLKPDQFLPESRTFQPDVKNGVMALDSMANQGFDPDTRRAQLQKFGWTSTYDDSYTDPQAAARTVGVFFVDSEVDLFATAAGASGMFEQEKADVSQQVGKTKDQVTLNNAQLFDATVADEATGASLSVTVQRTGGSSKEYRQIAVGFRRGRIVGNVTIGTLDTNDLEVKRLEGWAEQAALRLNAQIATVLSQNPPSASEKVEVNSSGSASSTASTPAAPSIDAQTVVKASLDKLAALDSFVVHITVDVDSVDALPASHLDSETAYKQRATSYYKINVRIDPASSQPVIDEYLLLPPDLYLHTSDSKWYVQSPWNQGIKPADMPDAGSLDPINQYQQLIDNIKQIQAVPDDVIDGHSYLRFTGNSDPNGQVDVWIDADNGAPYKVEVTGALQSAWDTPTSATTRVTVVFTDFNRSPVLPEAPTQTRPVRDLQLPQALCTGSAFAGCAQAQPVLASVAKPSCDGPSRRVCVVPLGQIDPTLVQNLAAYYQQQYGLTVTVLTPEPVPVEFASNLREQVDVSQLISYMTGLFPGTADNSDVVLIGLTPLDIYDSRSTFRYLFGIKGDVQDPKGVLSTFRMDPRTYGDPPDASLTFTRTQRLLSKFIGLMYYGLPTSHDSHSAMFDSINGPEDLDAMTDPLNVPSN